MNPKRQNQPEANLAPVAAPSRSYSAIQVVPPQRKLPPNNQIPRLKNAPSPPPSGGKVSSARMASFMHTVILRRI